MPWDDIAPDSAPPLWATKQSRIGNQSKIFRLKRSSLNLRYKRDVFAQVVNDLPFIWSRVKKSGH